MDFLTSQIMLYVATLMFTFAFRVFVPCLYSFWDLGSRDRVLGLCISLVLLGRADGEKLGLDWDSRSVTVSSCLQTDRYELREGKGGGGFASNHSRVEREALGVSSL